MVDEKIPWAKRLAASVGKAFDKKNPPPGPADGIAPADNWPEDTKAMIDAVVATERNNTDASRRADLYAIEPDTTSDDKPAPATWTGAGKYKYQLSDDGTLTILEGPPGAYTGKVAKGSTAYKAILAEKNGEKPAAAPKSKDRLGETPEDRLGETPDALTPEFRAIKDTQKAYVNKVMNDVGPLLKDINAGLDGYKAGVDKRLQELAASEGWPEAEKKNAEFAAKINEAVESAKAKIQSAVSSLTGS